jgi:N-acetylglutamate synthase-like GNAT family acetyltransferase
MLSKMFEDYAEERGFGIRIFETEYGFATYYLNEDSCYIEDIYVIPDKRKSYIASKMADEISKIAKQKGICLLYGSVNKLAKSADASRKVLVCYGFTKLEQDDEELEWYIKEI